jgi:hypothetical protein
LHSVPRLEKTGASIAHDVPEPGRGSSARQAKPGGVVLPVLNPTSDGKLLSFGWVWIFPAEVLPFVQEDVVRGRLSASAAID